MSSEGDKPSYLPPRAGETVYRCGWWRVGRLAVAHAPQRWGSTRNYASIAITSNWEKDCQVGLFSVVTVVSVTSVVTEQTVVTVRK